MLSTGYTIMTLMLNDHFTVRNIMGALAILLSLQRAKMRAKVASIRSRGEATAPRECPPPATPTTRHQQRIHVLRICRLRGVFGAKPVFQPPCMLSPSDSTYCLGPFSPLRMREPNAFFICHALLLPSPFGASVFTSRMPRDIEASPRRPRHAWEKKKAAHTT